MLLAAACLTGCAGAPADRSPDATLNTLVEEYFDTAARAVADECHRHRRFALRRSARRVDQPRLSREALRHRARLPRPCAAHRRRAAVAGVAHHQRDLRRASANRRSRASSFTRSYMPFNQMSGLPMDLAVYGSGSGPQPFKTVQDYDRFLKRVREFPRWADGAIAHDAHRHVTRHHAAAARRSPRWCRSCAASSRRRPRRASSGGPSPRCRPDFPAAERERLSAAYAAALTREVLPAYTRLADFLERDYLPAARTTVGWSDLPDGPAWYRWRIRGVDHHGHAAGADPRARPAGGGAHPRARCSR